MVADPHRGGYIYQEVGGRELVVPSGATITVESGGSITIGGHEVIGVGGVGGVHVVDAGLMSMADIFQDGPAVLYTPSDGERVVGVGWSDEGYEDFEPLSTASVIVKPQGTALRLGKYLEFLVSSDRPVRVGAALLVSAHPVIMQIADGDLLVPAAVGVWQANHVYALGDAVLAPTGSLQIVITAGTSDSSEPTWAALNSGLQTVDNDVHWTEAGPEMTQGKLHIYVLAATLAG